MKKVVCAILITTALVQTTHAETPTGHAYGWDSFMNAPLIRFPRLFGTWGCAGGMGFNYEGGQSEGVTKEDYTAGLYMYHNQFASEKANINLFYGFVFDAIGSHDKDEDTRNEYKVILGLEPEYFLVKHINLSFRTGLYFKFRDENRLDRFDTKLFCGKENFYNGISFNWYN